MEFASLADDFFVNLNLQTTLKLPSNRETVLHFCEAVQREFSDMTTFYQRDSREFVLEGDRDRGSYRWLELGGTRLSAGYFNPPSLEEAYRMHLWLLDRCVYFLGVSSLDVEAIDALFGFNLDYRGNRDAIVCQALLAGSPLGALLGEQGNRAIECEPTLVLGLDEDCYTQARLSLETRSNSYQVRTGNYEEEPISVYFTVRSYQKPGELMDLQETFRHETEALEDLSMRVVIPQVLRPIATAIASA